MKNVMIALPVNEAQAKDIIRRSYMNLGRSMMEYSAFGRLQPERIQEIVNIEGTEHCDEACRLGKGAVIFGGHYGNWELLGAALVTAGYPVDFLVGRQSNKLVDDTMNNLRRSQGIGIISRDAALRKVMRGLKDNRIVAMLADQDARKAGVFVEFLGRPASSVRGPAIFAIKQGCPVLVALIRRIEGNRHQATMLPPLWPNTDLDGDEAVLELMQRYTDALADAIRRYPDQYFWAHRRWKTQPA
jgi:KDO2-lipid IV(A) lauroyltransferase